MKRPVIVSPATSVASIVLKKSTFALYEWFKKMKYEPVYIGGLQVRRMPVNRALREVAKSEKRPHLACYYGHGTKTSIMGLGEIGPFKQFPLFHLDRIGAQFGLKAFNGYIFYTYSCSDIEYIKYLIKEHGLLCGYGSKDKIYIASNDTPFDDDTLDDFVDLTTAIPRAIALGKSTYEAFDIFKAKVDKYLGIYEKHAGEIVQADEFVRALKSLDNNFTVVGEDIKIVKEV